jgi:hypothetical protein
MPRAVSRPLFQSRLETLLLVGATGKQGGSGLETEQGGLETAGDTWREWFRDGSRPGGLETARGTASLTCLELSLDHCFKAGLRRFC